MVPNAGRKTKEVEDDGFFVVGSDIDEDSNDDSDDESEKIVRREVDKKGNVI